jgi:sulfur relay (sulfurtransferase) DsrC/TusE family protein
MIKPQLAAFYIGNVCQNIIRAGFYKAILYVFGVNKFVIIYYTQVFKQSPAGQAVKIGPG